MPNIRAIEVLTHAHLHHHNHRTGPMLQSPQRETKARLRSRRRGRPSLLQLLPALLLALRVKAAAAFNPSRRIANNAVSREAALLRSGGSAAAAAAAAAGLFGSPTIARGEQAGGTKEEGAQAGTSTSSSSGGKLYSRFFTDDIRNPGIASFGGPTLLFLPAWMLGEFDCTMTFDSYAFPLGEDYVPPQILRSVSAKAVDQAPTSFKLRFYSTLPPTAENTLRVNLGQVPKSEVVPDRVFNTRSVLDAYYGYPATAQIDYAIDKSPLRMQIEFATVGRDMQPLPKRRQELFINKLQWEQQAQPTDRYVSSEFIRAVTLSRSGVSVSDTETLCLYELQPDGRTVKGRQRVAVYLTPNPNSKEGAQFFETGGRAVALFNYSFSMTKNGDCVVTPKGVEQCLAADGGGASYRYANDGGGNQDEGGD